MTSQKICPVCGGEYPLSELFCGRDGTVLRSATAGAELVGSIIADRYHILKKLGEGGMGQVYLAEHVKIGRKNALKVMNPLLSQDTDAIARFNREAANASRLNHPNICATYDYGETPDGLVFLAMEYVDGRSLTALIESLGLVPPDRTGSIIHQTAEALQVAHDAGIVHRDLKPDNIMLGQRRDGSDFVKVVDFGISKAYGGESQRVTRTGFVVGTPQYMSPEQGLGEKLDGRSDIFSLALVAFNCLTGTLPYGGQTPQEAILARLSDPPKTLAQMRPDVPWPGDLQRVLDTALARDANARYQTAAEFGLALAEACQRMARSETERLTTPMASAPSPGTLSTAGPISGAAHSANALGGDAAQPAVRGPVSVVRQWSRRQITVASVLALAVLAAGGYAAWRTGAVDGATSPGPAAPAVEDSIAARAPAAVRTSTDASSESTTRVLSAKPAGKSLDPGLPALPVATQRDVASRAAGAADGATLVRRWLSQVDSFTEGSAQRAIDDLLPVVDHLSSAMRGKAYFVLGLAYFKRNKAEDGCIMWIRARPLVTGRELARITDFYEGFCR